MTVPTWPVAPTMATESPESEMRVMTGILPFVAASAAGAGVDDRFGVAVEAERRVHDARGLGEVVAAE